MARRRGRLIELPSNVAIQAGIAVAGYNKSKFSKVNEARLAAQAREAIRQAMIDSLQFASNIPYRTGRGIRSLKPQAFGTRFSNLRAHMSALDYMVKLDRGGEILPVNAQYLAIPIFETALRGDGSPKLPGPRSWANIKKTFVFTGKSGRKFIGYKGPDRELVALYVLVDSVELTKNTGWATNAWNRRLPALMRTIEGIIASGIDVSKVGAAYDAGRGRR